jgi:hypothetical protein
MKNLIAFILLLTSSSTALNACGYYPFGEDLRYCFFRPINKQMESFRIFHYTYNNYYDEINDDLATGKDSPNVQAWMAYCQNAVDAESVQQAVYQLKETEINSSGSNKMVRYLFQARDTEAIRYLQFAKQCEIYTDSNDEWEKAPSKQDLNPRIERAIQKAAAAKKKMWRKRYAFLAIRLAFYNGQANAIDRIYQEYFKGEAVKDLTDYWALYFKSFTETNAAKANCYWAQVFAYAPDKRYSVINLYNRDVDLQQVLAHAKTGREKANVRLMYCIRKPDHNLNNIEAIYNDDPGSEGLEFLLLREINKLEDWILTPTYSLFLPSTRPDYWENSNAARVLQRVEIDREYAGQMLAFVRSADWSKVKNPMYWKCSNAYLQFLTKDYNGALGVISGLEKKIGTNDPIYDRLQLLKGLCLTANQQNGQAIIPDAVKPILLQQNQLKNYKYVFAIGRELEMKGNTTDAALLFTKAAPDDSDFYGSDDGNSNNLVFWKGKRELRTLQDDYFYNTRGYIDAIYSIGALEKLIAAVSNPPQNNVFDKWLYRGQSAMKSSYYDLLGMKYIREDKLPQALSAFEKMDKYGGSRDTFVNNPFFKLRHTPEFPHKSKMKLTKTTITHQLIYYLSLAQDPKETNRDFYYFLAANCYGNMSFYGSAWEMRRIFRTSGGTDSKLSDEAEYAQYISAKKYYSLAMKHAKTAKFKALCLKLLADCEEYSRTSKLELWYARHDKNKYPPNPYTQQLKTQYSDYCKDLTGSSNCASLNDYFASRR